MRSPRVIRPLLLMALSCLLVMLPDTSMAHIEQGQAGGFLTGFSHPWSGLDHIMAMVAVGLWGAQLGNPAMWMLPITFPIVMSFGAFMGLAGIAVPGIEVGIALSAIVLGAMVFSESRPPLWAAALLVGVFAIFHGHAHGTELPEGQNGLLYSMGFVISTGLLHGVGITIGLVHRWSAGRTLLRACGAVISLAGCLFLWQIFS